MKIERKWAMPNKRTFTIKPIKRLIERETRDCKVILDLFPYPFERDALEVAKETSDGSIDCVLFDPPYSFHQLNVSYNNEGEKITDTYRRDLKKEICRIVKPGGIIISFGWNSNGVSIDFKPGAGLKVMEKTRILLVAHGGGHNDTIVTVERKIQETLE